MSDPSELSRPTTIGKIIAGIGDASALTAAMELDLFSPLRDGSLNARQLAKQIGVDAGKLELLLYVLVSLGLLTVEDGRFANSPEAQRFLVNGEANYMGGQHRALSVVLTSLLKTAQSVRTGVAGAKFDFAAMPHEQLANVIRGTYYGALPAGRAIARAYDFSPFRTLIDAGGGSGGVSVALTEACPNLTATVVDLSNVTPITQELVDEAGANGRVRVQAADIVAGPLTGSYDVALLRNVIHVLGPDEAARTLVHVGHGVRQGGTIYIIGTVLENSHLAPRAAVMDNLLYLNVYEGGQAYTEAQYRNWLEEAGFEDIVVHWTSMPDGTSVVCGRRRQ